MRRIFYFTLLGLSILGIPLFAFGIINTGVSFKYETDDRTGCFSLVTGKDLCLTIKVMQASLVICVLTMAILLGFRKKIFKQ
jgi:hypothetical protein